MESLFGRRPAEALQRVPFVTSLSGTAMCPAEMLDPSVDEMRGLFSVDGNGGPFPAADIFSGPWEQRRGGLAPCMPPTLDTPIMSSCLYHHPFG